MLNVTGDVRHVVAWLPAVRWSTCFALWASLAAAALFPHLDLPLRAITLIGLGAAICRTLLAAAQHRLPVAPRWLAGVSLTADAVLLTGLLDITGGPFNPFIVMYAVYVWLAAATLSPVWAAVVGAESAVAGGWLVVDHLGQGLQEHHRLNDFPTHVLTMWFAGSSVAELVGHYVARARGVLALRQRQLDEAREQAVRSERLASLTTLAAGAAHELSTPLATIAVAARELERQAALAEAEGTAVRLTDDARLIRSEVQRCQEILDSMSGRATHGVPVADPLPAQAIVELASSRLTESQRQRLRMEVVPDAGSPNAAGAAVAQALSSLLKNAFDASDGVGEVRLRVLPRDGMVRLEVHDQGRGFSAEGRRRAGEPFYTTKEPGLGLGLGLFLARTIAERAGGSLQFDGGQGTTAILEIPAAMAE